MRHVGPKNRLARREGQDLGLKTVGSKSHASLLRRLNIKPGQQPNVRPRKMTEYGSQLREKQKLKRIYGLTESQLQRYFDEANRAEGNTAHILVQLLETRLDNVLYKMGFAPTRASARQLVNHAHMTVNGKKNSIPSYRVQTGDKITFKKEASSKIPYISKMMTNKDYKVPKWVERKAIVGKVVAEPEMEHFTDAVNLQAVIEFYSR